VFDRQGEDEDYDFDYESGDDDDDANNSAEADPENNYYIAKGELEFNSLASLTENRGS